MTRSLVLRASAALASAALALLFSAPAMADASITIVGSDCTWANNTLTCTPTGGGGGSGVPTGCSISGPSSGTVGTPISLTATCSGGGAATAYSWTGGSCANVTNQTCSANESAAATVTYNVTPSNASGPASPLPSPKNVTWTAGGGGGAISCNGFSNTTVETINWSNGNISGVTQHDNYLGWLTGGFGANDALVIKFTTPANTGGSTSSNTIVAYFGGNQPVEGYLSATACDFTPKAIGVGLGPWSFSLAGTVKFVVNVAGRTGVASLLPNTTYYYNVRQTQPVPSCAGCSPLAGQLTPRYTQ